MNLRTRHAWARELRWNYPHSSSVNSSIYLCIPSSSNHGWHELFLCTHGWGKELRKWPLKVASLHAFMAYDFTNGAGSKKAGKCFVPSSSHRKLFDSEAQTEKKAEKHTHTPNHVYVSYRVEQFQSIPFQSFISSIRQPLQMFFVCCMCRNGSKNRIEK